MKDSVVNQVIEQLQELPDNLQRRVLDFVQKLKAATEIEFKGANLLQFAGAISHEDLEKMKQAIDSECETIDENEW